MGVQLVSNDLGARVEVSILAGDWVLGVDILPLRILRSAHQDAVVTCVLHWLLFPLQILPGVTVLTTGSL